MQVAISYVLGKTKTDFLSDIQCQDAVTRRVEIFGEAAFQAMNES
ncbi:MAG: HepT-like ribonuclease domain-containing protein [Cyanobacteria bacterium P01_A01_bin.114]